MKKPSVLPLDPRRAHAEALTASVLQDLQTAKQTFFSIGEKLHEMQTKRLYDTLGYPDFRTYINDRFDVAAAQAYKMIQVVRNFVRADAEKLGVERAVKLIRYAKLARVDPGLLVREDRLVGEKPVSATTIQDVARAIGDLRKAMRQRTSRTGHARARRREDQAIEAHLRDVLAKVGATMRGFKARHEDDLITVSLRRSQVIKKLGL